MSYSVLSYLDNILAKSPNKIAYSDENNAYTFREIDCLSDSIAAWLIENGYKNEPVSIMVERNAIVPAYYFAVAKAACFYAPMEATLPLQRLKQIMQVVKSRLLLVDEKNLSVAKQLDFDGEIVVIDSICRTEADKTVLKNRRSTIVDSMPIYVIFTSGSTGVPKGVITSHRAVTTYLDAVQKVLELNEADVIANQSPLDYIAAVRDIYLPAKTGASTVIVPKKALSVPSQLYQALEDNGVTTLCWSASGLELCVKTGLFECGVPSKIKKVLFSGSVLSGKSLAVWQKNLPDAVFINQYGPTEATASCTYYTVKEPADEQTVLPIGKPYDNYSVFILSESGEQAKIGEIGEICVSGPAVALGYYGNREATNKAFVQNPFNDNYREIIYKTGDLGMLKQNGDFVFCGRKDRQIKHMGHRIELDEIDSNALKIDGVDSCISLYNEQKEALFLFYTGTATKRDIALYFRSNLPAYMVPRKIVPLEEMPRLANGKININALKETLN